jgi:HAD superfamily hydrolase (TIGR01490 family)
MTSALLAGRAHDELVAIAIEHARWIETSALRPDTQEWMRWHQARGHRVVVISASFAAYVDPVARRLGADAVLATRWAVGSDGRLTGMLEGANVRGEEKVRLLDTYLEHTDTFVYGYGDSSGDAQLLERADIATWVRAGRLPVPRSAAADVKRTSAFLARSQSVVDAPDLAQQEGGLRSA